ncbi:MAG: hypothetical protein Ct9H300mP14_05360 [Gammaproteobacteria bacterium]|nr:MAG: hypothetical protein Ct9H300mP14_05360 [Gammaproteobacteria bacterium]
MTIAGFCCTIRTYLKSFYRSWPGTRARKRCAAIYRALQEAADRWTVSVCDDDQIYLSHPIRTTASDSVTAKGHQNQSQRDRSVAPIDKSAHNLMKGLNLQGQSSAAY